MRSGLQTLMDGSKRISGRPSFSFGTQKMGMRSQRKQLIGHIAGSKSFVWICEEEKKKRANGEDLTREDMFILTHTCKNGRPMNEASSVAMAQLIEQISQQPEASQRSTARNDVLFKVMGEDRYDRVCTCGLGPSPSGHNIQQVKDVLHCSDERRKI